MAKLRSPSGVTRLQVIEVHAARRVRQVAVPRGAEADVLAHDPQQDRGVVGEDRVVVQRVADGAPGELVGDQPIRQQLGVELGRDVALDDRRPPLGQAVAGQQLLGDPGVDVHEGLVDADHVHLLSRGLDARVLEQRIAGMNREIMLVFATSGETHGAHRITLRPRAGGAPRRRRLLPMFSAS
jgi:hypothetical protein